MTNWSPTVQDIVEASVNNALPVAGVTSATPDAWTELMPEHVVRQGAAIQNKDAAASIFIVSGASQPSSGTAPGEVQIPVAPAYYMFDFDHGMRWWVRSPSASIAYSLNKW